MVQTVGIYRVKGSKKWIRIISGGTVLFQILDFPSVKAAHQNKDVELITKERAIELTGDKYLFNY